MLPPGAGAIWKNGSVRIATSSPVSVPIHAGRLERRADVDRDDARVGVGRAHEVHVAHVVALDVVDEDALPLDEAAVLLARDARADVRVPISVTLGRDAAHVADASCRGRLHGLDDVPVARAAADVALQRRLDLVLGRVRVLARAARSRSSACPACSSRTGARGGRENARCSGVSSPSSPARPSTVRIVAPSAWTASIMQLLTARPSSCTVQAPQLPVSQPMCVPVRSRSSRMKCTSSRRASTSRSYVVPLISTRDRPAVARLAHRLIPSLARRRPARRARSTTSASAPAVVGAARARRRADRASSPRPATAACDGLAA